METTKISFALMMLMAAVAKVTPSQVSCDCLSMQALMTLVQHQTTTMEQQAVTIQSLQNQLISLQASVHQQSVTVSDLNIKLDNVESGLVADLKDVNTLLDTKPAHKVAFSAHMSAVHVNVGASAPFLFDAVVTNIGRAYNNKSGVFVAPLDGVYVFYFIMVNDGATPTIHAAIEKDGTVLGVGTSDGIGSSNMWDDGSVLVTTHLKKGSHVYVKRRDGGTRVYGGVYTNFSGFLLSHGA